MDIIEKYGLEGLVIGALTFVIIGVFHPLVSKGEYYFGGGIAGLAASLSIDNVAISAAAGVFAFSCFWSIKEVFEQRERVRKGWFPKNPKRKYPF